MIKKLKIKFIVTFMTMISLLLVTVLFVIYIFTANNLAERSTSVLEEASLRSSYDYLNDPYGHIFNNTQNTSDSLNVFVLEYYPDQSAILSYGLGNDLTDTQKDYLISLVKVVVENDQKSGVLEEYSLRFMQTKKASSVKIVFLDKNNEDETLASLVRNLILFGIGGIVFLFLLVLLIVRMAIRPVERSWMQQQQLVADVSHELKTPLAVISANTDIIASHPDATVAEEMKWLDYIRAETERMTGLVGKMLYLAKSEETLSHMEKSEINLSDLTEEVALPFESVCFEKKRILKVDISPDLHILGNANLYKQLCVILLDNACKYSNENTEITLSLVQVQEKIILSVHDFGAVIASDERQKIFQRFYRADQSRTHSEGSFGLGLSIARSVADFHAAKLAVTSDETEGTVFSCAFKALHPVLKS